MTWTHDAYDLYPLTLPNSFLPPFLSCDRGRIHDGLSTGISIVDAGTRGRLEGCDVSGNKLTGVHISDGADAIISTCK